MAYLRPYSSPISAWLKPGTKPPYPWAWRYWDFPHSPDRGPTPPLRPSPGRRAVTALHVHANDLVNQDTLGITHSSEWGAWEQEIQFEVDGGGFTGTPDVQVSVLSTDTAVQLRDKFAAALAAEGPPWAYCYAMDLVLGDRYQAAFNLPPGAYIMIVDANKGPLDLATLRTHITANSTHGSMYDGIPVPLYSGEFEVPGLPARWGFNRAVLPGPRVTEPEYLWQQ